MASSVVLELPEPGGKDGTRDFGTRGCEECVSLGGAPTGRGGTGSKQGCPRRQGRMWQGNPRGSVCPSRRCRGGWCGGCGGSVPGCWLTKSPSVSAQEVLRKAEVGRTLGNPRDAGAGDLPEIRCGGRCAAGSTRPYRVLTDWSRQRVVRRGTPNCGGISTRCCATIAWLHGAALPAAYMSWRDGLKARKEQIVRGRLQNGSEVLEITTRLMAPPHRDRSGSTAG